MLKKSVAQMKVQVFNSKASISVIKILTIFK